MQFPYTNPMSTHKLFQCSMHVFLFYFVNVNMNKRKYAHTINQSFIRMKALRQIYFEGKEDFRTLYFERRLINYILTLAID